MDHKCHKINSLLIEYCEGTLDAQGARMVEEHVHTCADCHAALAAYQSSWELLGAGEELEPPRDYVSRFWSVLAERRTWVERCIELVKEGRMVRRYAYRYAFIVVAILALNISLYKSVEAVQTKQMLMAMNDDELAMLVEYTVVANLDLLENLDVVESLHVLDVLENG